MYLRVKVLSLREKFVGGGETQDINDIEEVDEDDPVSIYTSAGPVTKVFVQAYGHFTCSIGLILQKAFPRLGRFSISDVDFNTQEGIVARYVPIKMRKLAILIIFHVVGK